MSVTVVLTSCNRPNELSVTLNTFFKFNTYTLSKFIIIDDSGKPNCIDECIQYIPEHVERKIIYNDTNIGQINAIDKAYSFVETEYIFHCEDDWEFTHSGFIEKSLDILLHNDKIFTVWLREYKNGRVVRNGHPVKTEIVDDNYRTMLSFKERTNIWNGFTFNPGLRRLCDYKIVAPYSQYINSPECNCGGVEQALSSIYYKKGYICAITLKEDGYVNHIGWNNPTH